MKRQTAEELQREGREIAAHGGPVFFAHPAMVRDCVTYQIPHIVTQEIKLKGPEQ
jgi:hypothetical protein